MMKKTWLVAALTAALVSGCATNQSAPSVPVVQPEPILLVDTSVSGITVNYETETVASTVKVMTQHIVRNGAFPKLVFQLVNVSQTRLPVEYKVQWIDKDGAPLLTSAPWLQATLSGPEAKPLVSIGKSADAASVAITVRFPQNVQIYVPKPDPVEQMAIERQVMQEYNARLAAGQIVQ